MRSTKKEAIDLPKPGLRERNKLDKINRIRSAALELFQAKGYEATTTKEIAEAADVAIGTVFMYANDKRDLLFLIFNDALDGVVEHAFSRVDSRKPLSLQAFEVFSHFYAAFHQQVLLARLLLRELVFFSEGKQAAQYMENRRRIIAQLQSMAREAMASGAIHADGDVERIANTFFFLYSGEVRFWLSDEKPDLKKGLASMKATFALLGAGLGEKPTGRPVTSAGKRAVKP
ncbi:MAG: TetR/AcrR family transcriptional regulator [Pseudomonadota bacterium]